MNLGDDVATACKNPAKRCILCNFVAMQQARYNSPLAAPRNLPPALQSTAAGAPCLMCCGRPPGMLSWRAS